MRIAWTLIVAAACSPDAPWWCDVDVETGGGICDRSRDECAKGAKFGCYPARAAACYRSAPDVEWCLATLTWCKEMRKFQVENSGKSVAGPVSECVVVER